MKGSHHLPTPNLYFSLSAKINGDIGKSKRMHCIYSSKAKGTYWAEFSSNSKPIALAIVELCLSEGISCVIVQSP